MEKYLDTSSIPKKSENRYDWKNSIGCSLFFKYGEHSGYIEIKDYIVNDNKSYKLLISINDKEKEILSSGLLNLEIGDILGIHTHNFKYDIGYVFGNNDNKMKITSRYIKSRKMYHAKCLKCGYEKNISEYNVALNNGCPVCSNMIVVTGINDMWTTKPELANMLENPTDGYKLSQYSHKKVIWKCPICNSKTKPYSPNYISKYGLHCKRCGDGYSYPNKFIFNLLEESHIDFISEKTFEWSNNKIYDFYLPKYNYIIEAHGRQHYQDSIFGSFTDINENDIYKESMALNNGIKKYIVIDCRISDPHFIMENISKSDLKNIIDISKIDINKIDLLCQKNILLDIVDLYIKNYSTDQISKMTKIPQGSVYRLLYKANELELIHYDKDKHKKEHMGKIQNSHYQNNARPIKCLNNGYVFGSRAITSMNSEQLFGRKIIYSSLCNSINRNTTLYGFKFVFITKEEFNETKMASPDMAFGDFFKTPYFKGDVK